jgi:hypothetical protein
VPAWLELVDDAYRIKEDAGKAVRRIFALSREGLGTLAIAAKLNEEKIPPIARGQRWIRSYVAKILDNPAVLGIFQPMKGHHQRTRDGEPIEGYFPAVVARKEWDEAHGAKQSRNRRSGRPGRKGDYQHVFSGILRDARDDCRLHVITRRGIRYLVSADAVQGQAGSHWRQFPLEVLVNALFSQMRELNPIELWSGPDAGKLTELEGRLVQVEKRLRSAAAHWEADPEAEIWGQKVTQYDAEKRALLGELAAERQRIANPPAESWSMAVKLMIEKEPQRLRAALLSTVETVTCLFVPRGKGRLAAAQVHFRGGAERSYLIVHYPALSGAVGVHPARTHSFSLGDVMKRSCLDLRIHAAAREMETLLAGMVLPAPLLAV